MKPLHAGLLIAGAALAGGLAVKMTQPQPLPAAAPVPLPVAAPIQQVTSPPPSVDFVQTKRSPFTTQVTPAPEEVFVESIQPEVRKNEPILTAKVSQPVENPSPLFVPPVPYEAPAAQPAEPKAVPAPEPQPAPASASPRRVTLPVGMIVPVRLNQNLSSDRSVTGDKFDASLTEPLVVDGLVIAERGARVGGRIVDAQKNGRLALELATISTADGQKISVSTDPWTKRGDSSAGEDAAKIGGGAALGAIIGAMAGGGKGAAIGAGLGGGVGIGAVAASHAKPANIASETIVRFRLATRVTITERQL